LNFHRESLTTLVIVTGGILFVIVGLREYDAAAGEMTGWGPGADQFVGSEGDEFAPKRAATPNAGSGAS
jgi:hypothetical protein